MKTAIATVSVPGSLREKLPAIAAAGFDGIEIFEQDFIANEASPRDVGRMVRDHGLEIALFQPFRDFECLPEPLRTRAFARAERKFDLMAELGTDTVLFCSSCHPASLGGIDRAAADFHALGEIAAPRGIKVGYEALCWGRHIDDHRDAWEVVRRADHPNIGVILDSFHTLGRGLDPGSIRAIPGDRIFFVQLADAPAIPMDRLYWSRHFRNMPGEGDLDVPAFLAAVMATGYAGPLSLEIFNDQFRQGLPRLVATDGHRSLINLADQVRRAAPALGLDLPAFPAPAPAEAVEFVEFVTGPEERPGIEALLSSAGFTRDGRHLTKPVDLWRQGAIHVTVNAGESGYAQAAYASHGATVGEIGLLVPDAAAAAERAAALGAERFEQPHGPNELAIPAVRGVGGSLIRFLDSGPDLGRVWALEFGVTGPAGQTAGLTGIDHLGQTMPYDEMLSWALFYTSIFAGEKSPMVDVIDPHGLVRSQAVALGGARFTLNGAEARQTLAGRFVEETFGSAVQHIAFASSDIFASAETMVARGFPILHIGTNYYDDLEARFGLDPRFRARLEAANVMYDEEEGGRFFQFYSAPRADGLFLEIVERQGHYRGYGAPNAPFRIAAQKRAMRNLAVPRL